MLTRGIVTSRCCSKKRFFHWPYNKITDFSLMLELAVKKIYTSALTVSRSLQKFIGSYETLTKILTVSTPDVPSIIFGIPMHNPAVTLELSPPFFFPFFSKKISK